MSFVYMDKYTQILTNKGWTYLFKLNSSHLIYSKNVYNEFQWIPIQHILSRKVENTTLYTYKHIRCTYLDICHNETKGQLRIDIPSIPMYEYPKINNKNNMYILFGIILQFHIYYHEKYSILLDIPTKCIYEYIMYLCESCFIKYKQIDDDKLSIQTNDENNYTKNIFQWLHQIHDNENSFETLTHLFNISHFKWILIGLLSQYLQKDFESHYQRTIEYYNLLYNNNIQYIEYVACTPYEELIEYICNIIGFITKHKDSELYIYKYKSKTEVIGYSNKEESYSGMLYSIFLEDSYQSCIRQQDILYYIN